MRALFWMGMMLLFMIIFLLAYVSMKLNAGLLNIMPVTFENPVIMVFSILGILRSLQGIWKS